MNRYTVIERIQQSKFDEYVLRNKDLDQTLFTRSAIEWESLTLQHIKFGDGWSYLDGMSPWHPITLKEFERRRSYCSRIGFHSPEKQSDEEKKEYNRRIRRREEFLEANLSLPEPL